PAPNAQLCPELNYIAVVPHWQRGRWEETGSRRKNCVIRPRSFRPLGLPIYVARFPAAPFGVASLPLQKTPRSNVEVSMHRKRLRSEEHTSELQSPDHLVCRLLLE